MDLGGIYEVQFIEELIRIYSCCFLDSNSFYSPVEGKKEFIPQEIFDYEPNMEMRQAKLKKMVEKMQNMLSPEKINGYIEEQLGDKEAMLATELPLAGAEDFVKVIYTRLYGQRKNMHYRIESKEEKEINGFRFRDFKIRRK